MSAPKTKELKGKLAELGFETGSSWSRDSTRNLWLAARNLPNVDVLEASVRGSRSLAGAAKVSLTPRRSKIIEERLR